MRSSRQPTKSSPSSPRDSRPSGAANAVNGSVSARPGPGPSSSAAQGRHSQKPSINVSGDAPMPSSPLAATTPLTSSTSSRNGQSPPPSSSSVLTNPSASSNPSTWRSEQESPGPTALLVPTDRPLEDLEQWLPSQSRLSVEKEVVLSGYASYGIRSWYLSRTHGAFTIAASTGKPSDKIHCYLLVPDPHLSQQEGQAEVNHVANWIGKQINAHARKTAYGTLLVSTPSIHGQEVWPIPGGDMREVWPYIVSNTASRRLGCGGRAAMGSELPISAIRRNFNEQYRIPNGPNNTITAAPSRAGSPPQSPTSPRHNWFNSQNGKPNWDGPSETNSSSSSTNSHANMEALCSDPIMLNVVESVKLIQSALAIWGLWGGYTDSNKDNQSEPDGSFCDETKAAIAEWRRIMGMENDDNFKIERETSGGVMDPKTLSALSSSITSTRYLLACLDCDKLPKDPFTNIRRFMESWRIFQSSASGIRHPSICLTVAGLRQLNSVYVDGRKGHATDALKVHRLLISGVANATSTLSANLKGGASEETPTPSKKREKHMKYAEDGESGLDMIVPDAGVGSVAGPDVITVNLEAYVKGILKSRERDWDAIGARRVAESWNGHVAEGNGHNHQHRGKFFRRRHAKEDQGDEGVGAAAIGAFKGMKQGVQNKTAKTGQAVKGALGMSTGSKPAKGGDTSDSETERIKSNKAQASNVPTVVGPTPPDVETSSNMSRSVSPAAMIPASSSRGNSRVDGVGLGRPPTHSPHNTFLSNSSGEYSDEPSFRGSQALSKSFSNGSVHHQPFNFGTSPRSLSSSRGMDSPMHRPRNSSVSVGSVAHDRTSQYSAQRPPPMFRTISDGVDSAAEWPPTTSTGSRKPLPDFANPPSGDSEAPKPQEPQRRHSLQDRSHYRGTRIQKHHVSQADVESCETVWAYMDRERSSRRGAEAMAQLEESAYHATNKITDESRARRATIDKLEAKVAELKQGSHRAAYEDVEEDRKFQWASSKIEFFLSEDTNTPELSWGSRELEKHWEASRTDYERNLAGLGQWRQGVQQQQAAIQAQQQQQQQQQQPTMGVISGLSSKIGS